MSRILTVFSVGLLVAFSSFGCGPTIHLQKTIRVTAGSGLSSHHLGRPVDANFEFLSGEDGKSLFPDASIRSTKTWEIKHNSVIFEDEMELKANLKAWGLGSGSGGYDHSKRYASFRASQISRIDEIDETTEMRSPPENARYYISRVFYGHSYEAVLHGYKENFEAGVASEFLTASGKISIFKQKHNLEMDVVGRGLKPKGGKAIFARTQEEIEKSYEPAQDAPVAIFVEYRTLPTRESPESKTVVFEKPKFEKGTYVISVVGGKVNPAKINGLAWDALNGLPDPKVLLWICGTDKEILRTRIARDTLQPNWTDIESADLEESDQICARVLDTDALQSDEIGSCKTRELSQENIVKGTIKLRECGGIQGLEIKISKH